MKKLNIKNGFDKAKFQTLAIAMQHGFLLWYSIPA